MPNYAYFSNLGSTGNNKKLLVQYNLPRSVLQRASTSKWENTNAVPRPNRDISIAKLNDEEIIIIGGMSGDKWTNPNIYVTYNSIEQVYQVANNKVYKYNMRTNVLTELIDCPFFTSNNDYSLGSYGGFYYNQIGNFMNEVVVGCYNNSVYICRGMCIKRMGQSASGERYGCRVYGSQYLYKLDLNSGEAKWEQINTNPSLPTPKHGEAYCQIDNRLYFFSGMNCPSYDWNTYVPYSTWWTSYIGQYVDEDTYPAGKSLTSYVLYMNTGSVEQLPDVPSDLASMYTKACVVGGNIYLVNRKVAYMFNPVTYEYTKLSNPTEVNDKRLLIPLENTNQILSIGGSYTSNVNQYYDIDSDSWYDAEINMQPMSGLAGVLYGNTIFRIGGVATTSSSSLCTNSINKYSLDYGSTSEQNPIVLKIPKGYYYHGNIQFEVKDKFVVKTDPQLATTDLDIKIGEYNCGSVGEVIVYLQQGEGVI